MPVGHRVRPLPGEQVVGPSPAGLAAHTLVYGALDAVQRRAESASKRQLQLPSLPAVVKHSNRPRGLLGPVFPTRGGDTVFSVGAGGRVPDEVLDDGEEARARGVANAPGAAGTAVHVVYEGLVVVHPWSPALIQDMVPAPLVSVGVAGLFGSGLGQVHNPPVDAADLRRVLGPDGVPPDVIGPGSQLGVIRTGELLAVGDLCESTRHLPLWVHPRHIESSCLCAEGGSSELLLSHPYCVINTVEPSIVSNSNLSIKQRKLIVTRFVGYLLILYIEIVRYLKALFVLFTEVL